MFFIKSKGKYYAFSDDSKIIANTNYSEKDKEKKKSTTYYVLKGLKNGAIGGAILGATGGATTGSISALNPSGVEAAKYLIKGKNGLHYATDTMGRHIGVGTLYGAGIGAGLGAFKGYLKSREEK